eukprot:612978-Prymnesium_polylepis.1
MYVMANLPRRALRQRQHVGPHAALLVGGLAPGAVAHLYALGQRARTLDPHGVCWARARAGSAAFAAHYGERLSAAAVIHRRCSPVPPPPARPPPAGRPRRPARRPAAGTRQPTPPRPRLRADTGARCTVVSYRR